MLPSVEVRLFSGQVVSWWGCLLVRLPSVEVVFWWDYLLISFPSNDVVSGEVIFWLGCLMVRSSSELVKFCCGCLLVRSSSIDFIFWRGHLPVRLSSNEVALGNLFWFISVNWICRDRKGSASRLHVNLFAAVLATYLRRRLCCKLLSLSPRWSLSNVHQCDQYCCSVQYNLTLATWLDRNVIVIKYLWLLTRLD